jgi:cytochrome c oxidase assembly protein subunit 15
MQVPPRQLSAPAPAADPGSRYPVPAWLDQLTAHLVVALVALVAVGGATRVMEAGLACPDWPLCYGVLLPGRHMNVQVFLEWFHRLDAFLVGLALLALAVVSVVFRGRLPRWFPRSAAAALLLVAVQGALGALTVLHLLPWAVVSAHLATALLLVALVSATDQRLRIARLAAVDPTASAPVSTAWRLLVGLAAVLVFAQCLLGGLMASRWAADLCLQAGEGCRWLLRHRLGAWPSAFVVVTLAPAAALGLPGASRRSLLPLAGLAALLVALQIGLGVTALRGQLSQPGLTVAHQLTAALLTAVLAALWGRSQPLAPSRELLAPPAPYPAMEVAHG